MSYPSTHQMIAFIASLALCASAAHEEQSTHIMHDHRHHRHRSRGRHLRRRRPSPKADEDNEETGNQDICVIPKPRFNTTEALSELESNRLKFDNLQNYDMRIQRSCFCYGDAIDPYLLSVRNGVTVSVANEQTGKAVSPEDYRYNNFPTIIDLFQIVETACTTPYANLYVTYDTDMGYPESVGYDVNECIADEENSYMVTDLVDMTPLVVDASNLRARRRRRPHQG